MPQLTASGTLSLSPRHQRILAWMKDGNRIFEVLGKKYFTRYEDKRDCDHRIRKEEIENLERLSLIAQVPNPDRTRFDAWEITGPGIAAITSSKQSL